MPYSGIYPGETSATACAEHDVTCVSGRVFHRRECGADVQFKLLQAVRLIDQHELFRHAGDADAIGDIAAVVDGVNGATEVF